MKLSLCNRDCWISIVLLQSFIISNFNKTQAVPKLKPFHLIVFKSNKAVRSEVKFFMFLSSNPKLFPISRAKQSRYWGLSNLTFEIVCISILGPIMNNNSIRKLFSDHLTVIVMIISNNAWCCLQPTQSHHPLPTCSPYYRLCTFFTSCKSCLLRWSRMGLF